MSVEIDPLAICISDEDGEIVYWDRAEWEEDPDVVAVIANAVKLYYTEGPAALRRRILLKGERS